MGLQHELAKEKREKQSLADKESKLIADLNEKIKEITTLKVQWEDDKKKIVESTAKLADEAKKVTGLQQELEKEKHEKLALEDKESKSSAELKEKIKEIATLKEQREEYKKKIVDLTAELAEETKKVMGLQQILEKEKGEKQAMEKLIADLEKEKSVKQALEKQVAHLEEKIKLLNQPTVRLISKRKTNFSLSVRDDQVVLAPYDPQDVRQHWIKEERFSTSVKDEEGFPSFALVNKAIGQAIYHSVPRSQPVQLRDYKPNELDKSVLWSETRDLGNGFRGIRKVNDTGVVLDSLHRSDSDLVEVYGWDKADRQLWKIVPYS